MSVGEDVAIDVGKRRNPGENRRIDCHICHFQLWRSINVCGWKVRMGHLSSLNSQIQLWLLQHLNTVSPSLWGFFCVLSDCRREQDQFKSIQDNFSSSKSQLHPGSLNCQIKCEKNPRKPQETPREKFISQDGQIVDGGQHKERSKYLVYTQCDV